MDNVAITAGSGIAIAADDVSSVYFQKIKLDLGTDGASAPALAGAGAVATGVQRMTLASDDPAVTALELLDNAVDGSYINVNVNAAGTDLSMNAGVLTAQTQRVTLATDGEANNFLGTIDADTGNMVTALQLLDNAVDGNYLNVNMNIAGTDVVSGEGVIAAGCQRITIATDDDAVAHLATIAGDTTAIQTAVEILDDWDDANYCNVNLNLAGTDADSGEGVLSANTLRVSLATDDDGVAHLATIAGDTTAIQSSIEAIDGAIIGPGEPTIDSYTQVAINLTTGADQVLVSSAASKQIWVYGYAFSCGDADAQSVSFQDEDDAAITGVMEFAQYGGISVPCSGNFSMPIWKLGTDKDLEIDILGGDVDGWLAYAIVSV